MYRQAVKSYEERAKTILLVEDNEDARFCLKNLLEMNGYRVVEAENGQKAIELASLECPDLVLMDLGMPLMDGIEASGYIRKMDRICDVPIIIVTAHDEADFIEAARAVGCNDYVTKPVDVDYLQEVVDTYCTASPQYG
jgi:two-component system, cell cycle response regulator DivK